MCRVDASGFDIDVVGKYTTMSKSQHQPTNPPTPTPALAAKPNLATIISLTQKWDSVTDCVVGGGGGGGGGSMCVRVCLCC